ncbi:hypothetical protein SAMN05660653_00305 [Desulfonatronum thiosulfatophilum]|uniref:Uncharacterized protein n=1 Tax=Desulfonatronum thiosulfatophilum TaxID=617002 RepID=A0A1G6AB94_9BACT|nr:hypothetical protein SAMN05660653_00305 [Desulfonatronum thiosulfatophilum]
MGIPRSPAEILKGDGYCVMNGEAEVVDINGDRVTRFFCLVHLVSWCYAKSSALKSQCWRNSVHRVEVQPFMTAASQVKKQLAWALQQLYCDDTGFTCLANMK